MPPMDDKTMPFPSRIRAVEARLARPHPAGLHSHILITETPLTLFYLVTPVRTAPSIRSGDGRWAADAHNRSRKEDAEPVLERDL